MQMPPSINNEMPLIIVPLYRNRIEKTFFFDLY